LLDSLLQENIMNWDRYRRRAPRDHSAPPAPGAYTGNFLSLGCRLAEFKSLPSIPTLTKHRPLFPGGCGRCNPLSAAYIVDPATKLLALKDMLRYGWDLWTVITRGGTWAHYLLLKSVRHVFCAGVIVSPGQIEVLETASKRGIPLLILPRYTCTWDHVVFALVLWLHGLKTPVVNLHSGVGPLSRVVRRCLEKLGVVKNIELVKLLNSGANVQTWMSLGTSFDTKLILEEQGDILAVPAMATYECTQGRWWGSGRVRVDFDQPVSLRELVSGKEDLEQEQFVKQHIEFNRLRLTRVTASQLVGFVVLTSYCAGRGVEEVSRGVEEIRTCLLERGVDVAFCGEGVDVVEWGVSILGGRIQNNEVELNIGGEQLWREARYVEQFFVPEAVIGTVVMGLVGQHMDCFREGSREGGITVSQEKLMTSGKLLMRLLGEDKRQAPPCVEIEGVLVEGITRVERWEGLGKVLGSRESQHGKGKWSRRLAKQVDIDNDWRESGNRYVDTELAVGVSISGRKWLKWVAGILKNRVRNMMYTTKVLLKVREQGVVRAEEVARWVREEVEKRNKIWEIGLACGDRELTGRSVEVLVSAGVLDLVDEAGVKWVSVTEKFDSIEMLEKVIGIVCDFKC